MIDLLMNTFELTRSQAGVVVSLAPLAGIWLAMALLID